jgi:hypothetical protein
MARMSSHGEGLGRREWISRMDWKRTERSCGSTVRASARIICEREGLCICYFSSCFFLCLLLCFVVPGYDFERRLEHFS